jgi:hypothetical protein
MDFKFEKLRIWQNSMVFGELVFEMSKTFPKEEENVQLSVSANFTQNEEETDN